MDDLEGKPTIFGNIHMKKKQIVKILHYFYVILGRKNMDNLHGIWG